MYLRNKKAMKNAFALILLLCSTLAFGQTSSKTDRSKYIDISSIFPVKDSIIFYTGVVNFKDSISKNDILKKSESVITSILKSDKNIIQSKDDDLGFIVSKGYIAKGHNMYIDNPQIWYTFRVDVKEGRYKYILTDVIYSFSVSVSTGTLYVSKVTDNYSNPLEKWIDPNRKRGKIDKRGLENFLKEIDVELKSVINSFNTKMQQKEDNW